MIVRYHVRSLPMNFTNCFFENQNNKVLRKIEKYGKIIYVRIIQERTKMYRMKSAHKKGFVHEVRYAVTSRIYSDIDMDPGQLKPYNNHALASANTFYTYNNKKQEKQCNIRKLFKELPNIA